VREKTSFNMTDLYFNVFLLKNKFSKIKRQNSVYIDKIIVKSNGDNNARS